MAKPGKPGRGSPHHHMKKPHEIKGASIPFIVDLAAYSMIYPDRTSIRFESPSSPDSDGIDFPTEEAAAAEFARIRAALLGEPAAEPQPTTGLPPLPPGEEWHNPDRVTMDKLPVGHRFMLKSEIKHRTPDIDIAAWTINGWKRDGFSGSALDVTYAVPLATWPLPRP